ADEIYVPCQAKRIVHGSSGWYSVKSLASKENLDWQAIKQKMRVIIKGYGRDNWQESRRLFEAEGCQVHLADKSYARPDFQTIVDSLQNVNAMKQQHFVQASVPSSAASNFMPSYVISSRVSSADLARLTVQSDLQDDSSHEAKMDADIDKDQILQKCWK